jgi:hypothetical protein
VRFTLPLLLFLAIATIARAADAPAPASQPVDARLWADMSAVDVIVGRIKDVTADFQQEKFTPLLKKPLISRGQVIGKSDRTLWLTQKPEPTKMLVDSSGMRIFYPDQGLEEIYPIEGQLGALASSPLPRIDVLRRFFSFERLAAASVEAGRSDADVLAVKMTPIDAALQEHVEEVKVLLDRKTGFILRAENIDADGEKTVLTFSNVKIDTGVSDDAMRLDVPAGTKISRPLDALGGAKQGGSP